MRMRVSRTNAGADAADVEREEGPWMRCVRVRRRRSAAMVGVGGAEEEEDGGVGGYRWGRAGHFREDVQMMLCETEPETSFAVSRVG